MLGVTRQSLRAALLDLTADGLVERIPNRGARVRVVSTAEAVAITECRMALEALCAVKAAERITDEEAVRLRELGEQLKRAVADGNPLKYSELNRELHRRVGAISGQATAVGLLDRLHAQLVRHQFQLAQRPGRPEPVAARAPGHHRRGRRPPARRRGRGRPAAPEQRHQDPAGRRRRNATRGARHSGDEPEPKVCTLRNRQ